MIFDKEDVLFGCIFFSQPNDTQMNLYEPKCTPLL